MPRRRRLLWVCLALSIGLLALALGTAQPPVETSSPATPSVPAPASAPLIARISVPAPIPLRPPVVHAQLGQLVELAVTPPAPDAISIVGFDRTHPGSPATPARFSLVTGRPGRFPLVLESSGRTVGVLEVGEHPRPSPGHRLNLPRPARSPRLIR